MQSKKIGTETQRYGEKHFWEKVPFLFLSLAKKSKSKRKGRGFLKIDLHDEPDDYKYLEKNGEDRFCQQSY